jgi:hypothetical protein
MRKFYSFRYSLPVAVIAMTAFAGCVGGDEKALTFVIISPAAADATSGSDKEKVQFTATGNFAAYGAYSNITARSVCMIRASETTQVLTGVNWSTSDSVNTSIDTNGLAQCLSVTAHPATITVVASGACGGVKATALLSCN